MPVSRRDFLRAGVAAGVIAASPRWLQASGGGTRFPGERRPIDAAEVRELALRAVEAATAAGASYADVRLTDTRQGSATSEQTWRDTGVRALVNGYWGFAASTLWTPDEVTRIAREAVHQAKVNALGKGRVVELGQIPVIKNGHWEHPVDRDPFEVAEGEILDFGQSLPAGFSCEFSRQDKAFASSEGSYCTQRLYRTLGGLSISSGKASEHLLLSSPIIGGASRGWEYIQQAPLRDEIERMVEELAADLALPVKPVAVGRYDVAFDAVSMAELLANTIGCATDLPRAMGYLAHDLGTSYMSDPLTMLGTYEAGAPLLTVLADRGTPGGLATVKWDDEGVEPDQFTLVKDGVLADFQTHREGAGWLQPAYARQGLAARSHGCAGAERAYDPPAVTMPNLTLVPGADALGFDELVAGMQQGLAVRNLALSTDWQCLNGIGSIGPTSRVYEVKNGKRVARIKGAAFLFRSPELWKGLIALGGAGSQQSIARGSNALGRTVLAVPGVVKQVTTIKVGGQ